MEAKIISQADMTHCEIIQTKQFEIGYYAQKSPLKTTPNEDSLGIITNGSRTILLVADGVGGRPQGEIASHLAVANIINQLKKEDKIPHNLSVLRQEILDCIDDSNEKLISEHIGSCTTLTACVISHATLQNIQIGDSCVIVCGQKGLLKYKALEHSGVGLALAADLLSEKAALVHPDRNIILNVLGSTAMHVDIGPKIVLAIHDTILLASDGLFDNFLINDLIEIIRKESLTEVVTKLTEKFQPMRDLANADRYYKIDDVSFIVCRQIS